MAYLVFGVYFSSYNWDYKYCCNYINLYLGFFIGLGNANYDPINQLLSSIFGKFIAVGLIWSFSFQMLSEVRHLIMDMGYGYELQTTRITGVAVIVGSFLLTILIYL